MTEEAAADKAMNALKHNRILEENTFILKDNPPDPEKDTDPYGNIMVHAPYIGWKCIHIEDLQNHINIYLCDYWCYTPPIPPPISNHD